MEQLLPSCFCLQLEADFWENLEMEETIPQCSKLCQEQHLIYDRASKFEG